MYCAYHSDARKSNSVLYVQNWFRRLEDFMSQAPLLQEALDELSEYKHPWYDQADFHAWAKAKYDTDWKFDPLTHHTSVLLAEVKTDDTILATTLATGVMVTLHRQSSFAQTTIFCCPSRSINS